MEITSVSSGGMDSLNAMQQTEESSKQILQAAQDLKAVEKVDRGQGDQESVKDLETLKQDDDKGNVLDLLG